MMAMSHVLETLHLSHLPTLRDFVVSSGFAGAMVLVAAILFLCAVVYASRRAARGLEKQLEQQERHHQETRGGEEYSAAVARCWERLVWLVEAAEIEPAARAADEAGLGLGPELADVLLRGLLHDAEELGDDTLTGAVSVYLAQFALVLAQQGGALDAVPAAPAGEVDEKPDNQTASPVDAEPAAAATAAADEQPAAAVKAAAAEGRHR
jgi:hypothetical protein